MANIIEHGLREFPQIGEEPMNLTPQEVQIPHSQVVGPLTSTPVKDRGLHRAVCGFTAAIASFRSHIVIQRSQMESHSLSDFNEHCQFCDAVYYSKEKYRNLCCKKGQVAIPPVKEPPTCLKYLFELDTEEACYFSDNVQTYNGALAFGSLRANTVIIPGKSCYVVQGQVYSDASECFPREGQPPMNQLWFVETDESAGIRCAEFDVLRKPLLIKLIDELHSCNLYAQGYQMMARHICS